MSENKFNISGLVLASCLTDFFAAPACNLFFYVSVYGKSFDDYIIEYPDPVFDRYTASDLIQEIWNHLRKHFPSMTDHEMLERLLY